MKMWYSLVMTAMSILIVILCPNDEWKEYVMFGLLVLMVAINRYESDKILKQIKANTSDKSKVLNIPDVSGLLPSNTEVKAEIAESIEQINSTTGVDVKFNSGFDSGFLACIRWLGGNYR